VEFGSKISVSLVDGIAIIDHLDWDAFESLDLQAQVESYKARYGHYPEVDFALTGFTEPERIEST